VTAICLSLKPGDEDYVPKGNIYNIHDMNVEPGRSHVVLINPSDSENLGTILRTGLGFGFRDYVIINPDVDIRSQRTPDSPDACRRKKRRLWKH